MKLELFDVTKSTSVFRLLGMVLILVTAVDGAASPSASSVHSSPYQAALAFDGRGDTRWASSDGGNQWVQMDLGKVCAIDEVVIRWERAHALDYDVQVPSDASSWQTAKHVTDSDGGTDYHRKLGARGRYLRILCLRAGLADQIVGNPPALSAALP